MACSHWPVLSHTPTCPAGSKGSHRIHTCTWLNIPCTPPVLPADCHTCPLLLAAGQSSPSCKKDRLADLGECSYCIPRRSHKQRRSRVVPDRLPQPEFPRLSSSPEAQWRDGPLQQTKAAILLVRGASLTVAQESGPCLRRAVKSSSTLGLKNTPDPLKCQGGPSRGQASYAASGTWQEPRKGLCCSGFPRQDNPRATMGIPLPHAACSPLSKHAPLPNACWNKPIRRTTDPGAMSPGEDPGGARDPKRCTKLEKNHLVRHLTSQTSQECTGGRWPRRPEAGSHLLVIPVVF